MARPERADVMVSAVLYCNISEWGHHGWFHDPLHDRGLVVDSNDEPESTVSYSTLQR